MAGSEGIGGLGTALYFTRQEDKRIKEMLGRHRRRIERKARRTASDQAAYRSRLDDAESDLGRMLLLAVAVNRTLLANGILSSDELAQVARRLDLSDGVEDGKLDPAGFRDAESLERKRPADPEEFLRRLESEESG
jgi:hypothetical protein